MKISDKLHKINESMVINRYDNGYMIEVSGRSVDDEWRNARIMITSIDEVKNLVEEFGNMPVND